MVGQQLLYLAQFHLARAPKMTFSNVRTAKRSWALEMVKDGVKLITLACSPSGKKIKPRWSSNLIVSSDRLVAGEPSPHWSSNPARRPRPRALNRTLVFALLGLDTLESSRVKNSPRLALRSTKRRLR